MSPDIFLNSHAEVERLARRVGVELERRLRSGEDARVEDFLHAHPELFGNADMVLDLLYAEYLTRLEVSQRRLARSFYRRFPQWRAELHKHFRFHEWLRDGTLDEIIADPVVPAAIDQFSEATEYELRREIARGTMGVVFEARHRQLQRVVALKIMRAGPNAEARELARFQIEARAIAAVQHPNVLQVFEVGQRNGLAYLALEYAGGGTLADRLADGPLPPRRAARLVCTLARAVQHIHERGVIHQDLNPSNILFTESGLVKIGDFGLARVLSRDEEAHPSRGILVGTPCYMAPEQVNGEPVSPLADVYALGAILYETLCGRPPFLGGTLIDTLRQVVTQEPAPIRPERPEVPPELERICLSCLAKDPRRRYADARGLARDLTRFLKGHRRHAIVSD